ncbi:hypothetical protein IVA79_09810 [Bradyrhizobium sp. 138]|uniref:hypothetical protein n=1 Tax=Bradyrhizobium sp. 138 TaxID=2782615 RepID=UPI001FF8035A|nr:hypothetical protein [Bradyrhizobium sp. 138]MCK1734244.1 hypothetical protein [Bradyrhizobium sp. 138]
MHIPSITVNCLAVLALACVALTLQMIRRRSNHIIFNGGILLAAGLLIAAALPILSRLSWTDLADQASDQAVAALHFLEVAYVILTL